MKRRILSAVVLVAPSVAVVSCSANFDGKLENKDDKEKQLNIPLSAATAENEGAKSSIHLATPITGYSNTVTDIYSWTPPAPEPDICHEVMAQSLPGFGNTITDHFSPNAETYSVPVKPGKHPRNIINRLDRSGLGTWTSNVAHKSIMKNGMYDSLSSIRRKQNITVDIFETSLFKYAVDMGAYMGKDQNDQPLKITHEKIEEIVKIFEKHVNYGPGAHMIENDHTTEYVNKMTLELYRSSDTPGLSMGSTKGVELSLHENFSNPFTMAALLLHEYGHHETMIDAKLFHDNKAYNNSQGLDWIDVFHKLKQDLSADSELSKFAKYFDAFYGYDDMDGFHIDKDIATPIGTLHKGAFAFGGPKYVYSSKEFVTRALMLLSISENKDKLMKEIQYRGELAGFASEFGDSPISDQLKEKFIKLFLNDVYPIDKFAAEGRDGVINHKIKAVVDGVVATRDINSTQIDHLVVNMVSRNGKKTTIKVASDQLRRELGEFHFNTNFNNDSPEIIKRIYMYSIDTSKLSKSDAEEIKDWLNFTAQVEFYDADGNLMKTTGV